MAWYWWLAVVYTLASAWSGGYEFGRLGYKIKSPVDIIFGLVAGLLWPLEAAAWIKIKIYNRAN